MSRSASGGQHLTDRQTETDRVREKDKEPSLFENNVLVTAECPVL